MPPWPRRSSTGSSAMRGSSRCWRARQGSTSMGRRRKRPICWSSWSAARLAKRRVVIQDERDTGDIRIALNLGHTLSHALEAATGYRMRHGEAVAYGLRTALEIGTSMGITPPAVAARATRLLRRLDLGQEPLGVPVAEVLEYIEADKKRRDGKLRWVLVGKSGAEVHEDVPPDRRSRGDQRRPGGHCRHGRPRCLDPGRRPSNSLGPCPAMRNDRPNVWPARCPTCGSSNSARSSPDRSPGDGSRTSAPRSSRSSTRSPAIRFAVGRERRRRRVALAPRPVARQALGRGGPPRPCRPGVRSPPRARERPAHRELPTRPARAMEPGSRGPHRGQSAAGRGPDLRLRPDRPASASSPGSGRSPRPPAGSATSPASRTAHRHGSGSASATRSHRCTPWSVP